MNSYHNVIPSPGDGQGPVHFPRIRDPLGLFGSQIASGENFAILGPSRKIPPKRGSLSGHLPFQRLGRSVWFESSLERDFLKSLKPFDGLIGVLEQPVPLNCKQLGFTSGVYRPDFLVWIRASSESTPKPVLIEIKYEDELQSKWSSIRPKLMAGRRFARRQGWRFLLITPRHLRVACALPHVTSGERYTPYRLVSPFQVLERLFGSAYGRSLL